MYHWYYPYYIPYMPYAAFRQQATQYPAVNVTRFRSSAEQLPTMLKQAETFAYNIIDNKQLRIKIKEAAQRGENEVVNQLIRSAGIKDLLKTSYTPDTIHILLQPTSSTHWSDLVLTLRW